MKRIELSSLNASRKLPVFLVVVAFIFGASQSFAQPWVPQQYPLHRVHLSWSPERATLTEDGEHSVLLNGTWSSTSILRESYRVDAETRELDLDYRFGLSDTLELSVFLPFQWRGGGVLDHSINQFHQAFGFPEGGRDRVSDDEYFIAGELDRGDRFSLEQEGFGLGNSELALRAKLPDLGLLDSWIWHNRISLPGATTGFGHQGVDLGTGIAGSSTWGRIGLDIGAALLYFGDRDYQRLLYESFHPEAFFSLRVALFDNLDFFFSTLYSGTTLRSLDEHPDYVLYQDFGLTYPLTSSTRISAWLRENPGGGRGSADFSLGLSLVCLDLA